MLTSKAKYAEYVAVPTSDVNSKNTTSLAVALLCTKFRYSKCV